MNPHPILSITVAAVVAIAVGGCAGAGAGGGGGAADGSGTVAADRAVDAMVAALEHLSLDAQRATQTSDLITAQGANSPSTRDYIATEVDSDGDRVLKLYVGSDGNLIPTPSWRDANSGYCADRNRYMKSAVDLLNVKVYPVFEGEAELVWIEHNARSTDPIVTYNSCPAPDTGTVSIVYRADSDGTPDSSVDATLRLKNVGRPDCTYDSSAYTDPVVDPLFVEVDEYWKKYHDDEHQGSDEFLIEGWDARPAENSIVAEKTYDFTETTTNENGTLTYEEETTLKITL